MTIFLSSYVNGVDKKGRVSVPASFRSELSLQSRQMIVLHAVKKEGCIYGWGYDDFVKFAEKIKRLPALSPERQRLARGILAAARPLNLDGDGRIVLPEDLRAVANIDDKILFAGQGENFTIWNPVVYETKQAEDVDFYAGDIDLLSEGWDTAGE